MVDPFDGFSDDAPVGNGMVGLPEIPEGGFDRRQERIDRIRYPFDPVRRS